MTSRFPPDRAISRRISRPRLHESLDHACLSHGAAFEGSAPLPGQPELWNVAGILEVTEVFFGQITEQARAARLLSEEHFTGTGPAQGVRGSFRPEDEQDSGGSSSGGKRDFHGTCAKFLRAAKQAQAGHQPVGCRCAG